MGTDARRQVATGEQIVDRNVYEPPGQNTKPYADGFGRLVRFDTKTIVERARDQGKILAGFV